MVHRAIYIYIGNYVHHVRYNPNITSSLYYNKKHQKYDLNYLRCLLKIVDYHMAKKVCNFMVSGSVHCTLKLLKSVNCMEIYYTTDVTLIVKLGFIKLNSISF